MSRRTKKARQEKLILTASIKLIFYIAAALFTKNQFDQMGGKLAGTIESIAPHDPFLKEQPAANEESYNAQASIMAKTNIR